ncbi:MAG: NADH-quinone oxidoreductase subunit N [Chloroflexi bacterium]|nr:NADH-quinone oxidoreductase subunit N [Chloroflexota bacterium]
MNVAILSPEISLGAAAAVILLAEAFSAGNLSRVAILALATLGIAVSAAFLIPAQLAGVPTSSFSGAFIQNGFTIYFKLLMLMATFLVLLGSGRFLAQAEGRRAELVALVLLTTAALMLLVSSTELITLYISLEMASLSTAFLAAWMKHQERSAEAGLKFFLLNALSSAVLLYGIALLYGITGQTQLNGIARELVGGATPALLLALALLLAGFGFKVSAVPFHMWTPDVYEGAPTPITAYLSVASKAAGFAVIVRVLQTALPGVQTEWVGLIAILAAVTMTVGNIVAMVQTNIKRMLAYSTIAQAGYILVGVAAGTGQGLGAVLFYLAAYTATNLGAFIAIVEIADRTGSERTSDFAGLHARAPWLAFALAISLLSLAGLPPLAGFFAKIYVFWAAIQTGLGWLVLLGVLNSAISLFYYAQVIHHMYMVPAPSPAPGRSLPTLVAGLTVAIAGVFALGIFSGFFMGLAETAARTLTQ